MPPHFVRSSFSLFTQILDNFLQIVKLTGILNHKVHTVMDLFNCVPNTLKGILSLYQRLSKSLILSRRKEYLSEWEKVSFRVLEHSFLRAATRLGSSAEPSQQVCSLQSAGLLILVVTPFSRTTINPLVVQL